MYIMNQTQGIGMTAVAMKMTSSPGQSTGSDPKLVPDGQSGV